MTKAEKLSGYLKENGVLLHEYEKSFEDLMNEVIAKNTLKALKNYDSQALMEACTRTFKALEFLLYVRVSLECLKEKHHPTWTQKMEDALTTQMTTVMKTTTKLISALDQSIDKVENIQLKEVVENITQGALDIQNKIAEVELLIN